MDQKHLNILESQIWKILSSWMHLTSELIEILGSSDVAENSEGWNYLISELLLKD